MFCIEYEILEEEKARLSNVKEFELDNIAGQMRLVFNDKEIGFVDKEIPYDGELLLTWFQKLNEVIIQLRASDFITMWLPDSTNIWLEFKSISKIILISKIRAEAENHIEKTITNVPKKREEIFWSESIEKENFLEEVFESTNKLIQESILLNRLLLESKELVELKNTYEEAKHIWCY